MPLPFRDQMKRAREACRYPRSRDFASAVGMSVSGYTKIELGTRIPTNENLENILNAGAFPEEVRKSLWKAWRKAKADQAGIPTPQGDLDVHKVLNQMGKELTIVLRKQAPELSGVHAKIVGTFKKRAEIILRTGLET